MLLTISTTHYPASDLGYLLQKNPHKLHKLSLSCGSAYVFYPQVTENRCIAVLLLDIDPIKLVRKGSLINQAFALEQYVNDRPYVASSMMSVAILKAFGNLLSGRSKYRQHLVDEALSLEVRISVIPSRGGASLLRRLFEPLGYEIEVEDYILDKHFPEWGKSPYFALTLRKNCPLREFLTHLYVLIPVLDNDKHYWIGEDEIKKLVKFGEGWLASHPEKNLITSRYLKHFKSLVQEALERLSEGYDSLEENQDGENSPLQEESLEKKINLYQERMEWVVQRLKACNASKVLDLGCGEGKLIHRLLQDKFFEKITGSDVCLRSLQILKERLKLDRLPSMQKNRLTLLHSSLAYRDSRFSGYDAITLIEVIEHMDISRLDVFKRVVFEFSKPQTVLITTPNSEYNTLFCNITPEKFRHSDHRFEWTRDQFEQWAQECANQFGYSVTFEGIGQSDPTYGSPTQAGIFTRND